MAMLRQALEQVRRQACDPVPVGNIRILTGAIDAYFWPKSTSSDRARAETTIINCLRADGHLKDRINAYIEPDCVEHNVIHVNHFGDDFDDRGEWLQIERDGKVSKL